MVLTKSELVAALQHEVLVLLHLATKVDPTKVDYRPTPKQRSTLELLRYLSMMGPTIVRAIQAGAFDPAAWTAEEKAASAKGFDQTVATIATHPDLYASLLAGMSDADLRAELELFGTRSSCGAAIVRVVLSGHAAYRTQLFNYLKACGREELSTMNLWAGMDAPA